MRPLLRLFFPLLAARRRRSCVSHSHDRGILTFLGSVVRRLRRNGAATPRATSHPPLVGRQRRQLAEILGQVSLGAV
jgi:hypothetical protein